MRSTDDQLREIMRRAELVKEKRNVKKVIMMNAVASGLCVALLITVAVYLPNLSPAQAGQIETRYGSLLLAAPYIGYVIVGLLAFALGVSITLLCIQWKKWKERDRK